MGTPIDPNAAAVQGGDSNTPGPNPAWNDVLSAVPEQYHGVLTENFQKWDQAAQSRIEQANQQVKAFEAYKPFVDNEIPAEELENGLRIMYEINTNPQSVWEALGKAYNLTPQQVQQVANDAGIDAAGAAQAAQQQGGQSQQQFADPRVDKLQQGIELVSQIVLQDQQAKQAAEQDRLLDQELKALEKTHGAFDQGYVLAMMQNGMDGAEAVQAYQNLRTGILQNGQAFAPDILGSNSGGGSGYPSQAIDPTKLDGKGTRSLVAQMLEAANRQP
jgi:hypothetical protein